MLSVLAKALVAGVKVSDTDKANPVGDEVKKTFIMSPSSERDKRDLLFVYLPTGGNRFLRNHNREE